MLQLDMEQAHYSSHVINNACGRLTFCAGPAQLFMLSIQYASAVFSKNKAAGMRKAPC